MPTLQISSMSLSSVPNCLFFQARFYFIGSCAIIMTDHSTCIIIGAPNRLVGMCESKKVTEEK